VPLPRYELGPEGREVQHKGHGFTDITVLLKELHEGILELGVGDCACSCLDRPRMTPPHFGFELYACYETKGVYAWWHFLIPIADFRKTCLALPQAVQEAFLTTTGRSKLAKLLGQGMAPKELEKALASEALRVNPD
jgi:hypothetical protein